MTQQLSVLKVPKYSNVWVESRWFTEVGSKPESWSATRDSLLGLQHSTHKPQAHA